MLLTYEPAYWGVLTVSKALDRFSSISYIHLCPLFSVSAKSITVITSCNWISQDLYCLNPWCSIMSYYFEMIINFRCMIFLCFYVRNTEVIMSM